MKSVFLILLFLSETLMAEPVIGSAVGDYSGDIFRVILSLGLVLLVFYIGVLLYKKYLAGPMQANSSMKVIGGMSLTSKDKLLIVEAGGVNLLLAISNNGITKLHAFAEGDLQNSTASSEQENISFSSHLNNLMNKKSL